MATHAKHELQKHIWKDTKLKGEVGREEEGEEEV